MAAVITDARQQRIVLVVIAFAVGIVLSIATLVLSVLIVKRRSAGLEGVTMNLLPVRLSSRRILPV